MYGFTLQGKLSSLGSIRDKIDLGMVANWEEVIRNFETILGQKKVSKTPCQQPGEAWWCISVVPYA
jgi:hypothetical protein